MEKEIYLTKEELIDFKNEVIKLRGKTLEDSDLEKICGGIGKGTRAASLLMALSFLLPTSSISIKSLPESKSSSSAVSKFLGFKKCSLMEKLNKNKKIAIPAASLGILGIAGVTTIAIVTIVKLKQAKNKKQFLSILKDGIDSAKTTDDLKALLEASSGILISKVSSEREKTKITTEIENLISGFEKIDIGGVDRNGIFKQVENLIDELNIKFSSKDKEVIQGIKFDSVNKEIIQKEMDNNIGGGTISFDSGHTNVDIEEIQHEFESISKELPHVIPTERDRNDEKCIASAYVFYDFGAGLENQFPYAKDELVKFSKIVEKYSFCNSITNKLKEAEAINDINDACKFVAELKGIWEQISPPEGLILRPVNQYVNHDSPILTNSDLKKLFSTIINQFFDYFNDCKLIAEKGPGLYEKQQKEDEQKKEKLNGDLEDKVGSLSTILKQFASEKEVFTNEDFEEVQTKFGEVSNLISDISGLSNSQSKFIDKGNYKQLYDSYQTFLGKVLSGSSSQEVKDEFKSIDGEFFK